MKTFSLALLAISLALTLSPSLAGPGAHGPNGEHLDSPSPPGAAAAARPRLEAQTELFELVATLYDEELSILIDRWATNEPVLGAQLTVESGGLKAVARFHAEHGDYAINDAKLLAKLRQPGEHALVFTLVAADDSDLLDGTLRVAAPDGGQGPGHWHWKEGAAGAVGLLLLAGGSVFVLQRRRAMKGAA